jgi:hypothetical protein
MDWKRIAPRVHRSRAQMSFLFVIPTKLHAALVSSRVFGRVRRIAGLQTPESQQRAKKKKGILIIMPWRLQKTWTFPNIFKLGIESRGADTPYLILECLAENVLRRNVHVEDAQCWKFFCLPMAILGLPYCFREATTA